jgi:tRNA A-37 threonylcarbamoyl transferase component Bud32
MPDETTASSVAQPRRKLGKYELVERFERGGMATVYKAYDPMLDRYVAIKQIASHLADNPQFVERFRHEAQVLAKLGNEAQHVVSIYELVEDEAGGLFIVMEYVEGRTLEAYLASAPIAPAAALKLLGQIAAGLRAVHGRGIIHRDIKPQNILITPQGRVKITDFGLAARSGGRTSLSMGTTKYMAPELPRGGVIDGRADLYSLGFLMYELLCPVDRFNELFEEVLHDERSEALRWMSWHADDERTVPPLIEVNPQVPKRLSVIIERLMAKDPERRFAGAEDLLAELKARFGRGSAGTGAIAGDLSRKQLALKGGGADDGPGLLGTPGESASDKPRLGDTAPLPKARMSLRKRLVIIGAALVVLIAGLIVAQNLSTQRARRLVSAAWTNLQIANDTYYDGGRWREAADHYAKGLAVLRRLRSPSEKERERIKEAEWKCAVAQAYVAIDERRWPDADAAIQRVDQAGAERSVIYRVRTDLVNTRAFVDLVAAADLAAERHLYDEALKRLEEAADKVPGRQDVEERRVAFRCDKAMYEAREALKVDDYDKARTKFQEAKTVRVAAGLDTAEVDKELSDLAVNAAFYRDVLAGRQAHAAGDFATAVARFEDALQRRDDPRIRTLLTDARYQEKLKAGRDKENAQLWKDALDLYQQAQAIKDTPEVQDRIKAVQVRLEVVDLVAQASAAETADDLDRAIELWTRIKTIDPKLEHDAKLIDLQYRREMKQGKAGETAGDWAGAEQHYTAASRWKQTPEVTLALQQVKAKRQHQTLMEQGKRLLDAGLLDQALTAYEQAQKALDTPEVQQAIQDCRYEMAMRRGKAREEESLFREALAEYSLAQRYKNTADVQAAIDRVRARIPGT